jgi:hypothetical protein
MNALAIANNDVALPRSGDAQAGLGTEEPVSPPSVAGQDKRKQTRRRKRSVQ